MTATMACRGPDAAGSWVSGHAALGHRRLAVIDVQGGAQPMTARADGGSPATGQPRAVGRSGGTGQVGDHGGPSAVITYSGEVYNYRELRAELSGRGHRFRTASDTEVVLRAYLEWGEHLAERLNGMFAFAVWDTAREELLLVRDRMGVKPLYYARTPGGLLFGSEPKAILVHPEIEPVVDSDGLREVLSLAKTPGHGVSRGMAELRPGSVLRLGRDGIMVRRYWQLEAIEHTDDRDATVATVRDLLEDIVERQLISDVPLCTLPSEGLDSSAVTALAARKLAAGGSGPVRSFALDFAGYSDNFTADALRETPDAPYARQLARHVGAEHSAIVLFPEELIDPANRAAVVRASDFPLGGNMITAQYLLFAGIRGHSTVALSGESADEVFGGYRWLFDESVTAGTFSWVAFPGRARGHETTDGVTPFTDEVLAILDIERYQRDMYRTALAEVPHTDTADLAERRMREACYLHLTRWVQFLLDRKDRMSMANGLEVRVPFCDHRLVQYVFNTPWSIKTFDGREKSLLRAAVADLLPGAILRRTKAPFPATHDPAYTQALLGDLGKLVTDGVSPVLALLDTGRTRRLLGHDPRAMTVAARSTIETVLAMDDWLSATGARLDLTA